MQPKRKQAEHFSTNNGVQVQDTGDVQGGGKNIAFIDDGDYVSFDRMNLSGIDSIRYRVASASSGGLIEVHVDAPDGELINTAAVEPTGDWQIYTDVLAEVTDPGGTHELFFVFLREVGDQGLFNVNWIDFNEHSVDLSLSPDSVDVAWMDDAAFTMTVENTGNVTLTDVTLIVTDHAECDASIASLSPGEVNSDHTCELLAVTEDVSIDASATGTPSVGGSVSSDATANVHLDIVCGDLDLDGEVGITDIVIYLQVVVDLLNPSLYHQRVGDLNLDGVVGIIDAIMGLEYIMNASPTVNSC